MFVCCGRRRYWLLDASLRAHLLSVHQSPTMHVRIPAGIWPSLAKQRIASCGLQDRVTVICTEITRDRYMSQLVDYLQYYNAHFDTVMSLLPSGVGLIHYVFACLEIDCRLFSISSSTQRRAQNPSCTSSEGLIGCKLETRYYKMLMWISWICRILACVAC